MKKEIICGEVRHEKIHLASVCSFHDESLKLHTPRAGGFFFKICPRLSSWDTRIITIDFVVGFMTQIKVLFEIFEKNWKIVDSPRVSLGFTTKADVSRAFA